MTPPVDKPSLLWEKTRTPQLVAPSISLRYWMMGLLVALISTLALSAWAQPGGREKQGGMWGGSPQHMQRLLSGINATDEQKVRIQQIMQRAASDMAGQTEARRTLREQARAIFAAPTVDASAAEQLRQQMLAQHDQKSRRMMSAMLEVSAVLTPEQRSQMAQQMQNNHRGHHGDGRQGRRGKPGGPGEPQQP
jgi:periplasmic protein CpxP/Spy